MKDKIQLKYDLDSLRRRIPRDRAEMFIGFVPWVEDTKDWQLSVKEGLVEKPERSVIRTVWDNPENRDERILIDVVECPSASEALEALVDRLRWNQLAQLPKGPKELGDVSFMHPEGVPPAIFFTRGNLCLSVISFGKIPKEILSWVELLNKRLDYRPKVDRTTISLHVETTTLKIGQEIELDYELPWQYGDEGFLKFLVRGGILIRRNDRLILIGTKPGEIEIDVYLVEPGREPHFGHLSAVLK